MPETTRIVNAAAVMIAVCACVATASVVRRELSAESAAPPKLTRVSIDNWRDFARDGQRVGPSDAAVTITEFSDFQCPFCARFAEDVAAIRKKHPNDVAVVYRHFPLQRLHAHAMPAALASECAAAQGRFAAFHDALFAVQDSIGVWDWIRFAKQAGVSDSATFSSCLQEKRFQARVDADMKAAKMIGANGTPTVLINETRFLGSPGFDELERLVTTALERKKRVARAN